MRNSLSANKDFILWVLLLQAKDTVFKVREKELSQYSLSPEQAAVLFIIQTIGETATPAVISRWLFRKHHTVSGLLSRIEKKGLIRRTKDLARKNMIRVTLTEKGRQAYYQASRMESIGSIMSSLSEEERQQLSSCLQTLRARALKELGMDAEPPLLPSQ